MQQLLIMLLYVARHLHLHLRQVVAVLCQHLRVGHAHYVQHHIIIFRVVVMAVMIPVARLHVYLYIAHPERSSYAHLGIEEVGTCIPVVQAGINHLHLATVGGLQGAQGKHFMSPDVMQQLFHTLCYSVQRYEKKL